MQGSEHACVIVCVLLCFIELVSGNHYSPRVQMRADLKVRVPTKWITNLNVPPSSRTWGHSVAGSSPSTLTTSLAIPVPSSSSSNGPAITTFDNQGQSPVGRSKVLPPNHSKICSHGCEKSLSTHDQVFDSVHLLCNDGSIE